MVLMKMLPLYSPFFYEKSDHLISGLLKLFWLPLSSEAGILDAG
jgi:hypothetical protein